ncbi:MAG: glycoside hydrolase family 127 protein [Kiritimatiellae bacterium]|nr:glycoside hydrolase family 127 protein [Kiritimatiellia bacterium]
MRMSALSHGFLLLCVLCSVLSASADNLTPLSVRDVKVGGEIGRRIDITINNNLLKLDIDRDFLQPFRRQDGAPSFIGLGMLIDSSVRLAAYSDDPKVLALKRHIVGETLKLQSEEGYIGLFPPEQRITSLWDVHELGYVVWGLLNDYRFYGEQPSLAGARKAADYIMRNWSKLTAEWDKETDVAPNVAFTGLERTMLALYQETREQGYLDFVVKTRSLPEWDLGIVIGRRKRIEGHVYAYICRSLAQLELNSLQADPKLTRTADRAIDFMTRRNGMLITGSTGQIEVWTDDQDARGDAGETCAVAYQLRFYDNLLCARGEAKLGDLMERTIFNALFASQSPDGRNIRYYTTLEGERVYFDKDTYCCPCNYRRIIAELPSMVYYKTPDGLAVNLYTPSQAKLALENNISLAVRQSTSYPGDSSVRLTLEPSPPATFTLRLRIPAWASGASATVNGASLEGAPVPGTFFDIRRLWKAGDLVDLELPMRWRLVKGRQRQAGRVAVMRGPLVFCLNPEHNTDLAQRDGSDLGYVALNPAALSEPVPDASVRPDGIACCVQAWAPGFSLAQNADYALKLTEFADPDGKATYFRLRDFSAAVDDELLSGQ